MIGALREWLTSIVVVTLLLSVAQALVPEGNICRVASFLGGLILLLTMLRPATSRNSGRAGRSCPLFMMPGWRNV